jgi:hypothetical protein
MFMARHSGGRPEQALHCAGSDAFLWGSDSQRAE